MLERECLVIIQTAKGLQITVCHVGLRTCEMVYTQAFACDCDTPESLLTTLQEIQTRLQSLQIEIPKDIRLCLLPTAALFREWAFPFRTKSKIKQALALLLDAEFPFGAGVLEHRTYYAENIPMGKSTQVITVSCTDASIQEWVDALTSVDWYPSLITFDPFPLLHSLPKLPDVQLILHVQAQHTTVSLVDNGCVRRIRYIAGGLEKTTDNDNIQETAAMKTLLRDIAVVLDGIVQKPTQLILFGDCFLQAATTTALAEALDLPASVLGRDIPYAKATIQDGEQSLARLAAVSLASMPAWVWRLQSRCPSFHRPHHVQSALLTRYRKYIAPLCTVGLVTLCYLIAVWAQGYALHKQAAHYEEQTRIIFREAAPDARNVSSMRQMRSVLSSKINATQDTYDESTAYFILKALTGMHTAIPDSIQVRISRISFDRGRCQISGIAGSYEQVESIRQELAKLKNVEKVQILRATAQDSNELLSMPKNLPEGAQNTSQTAQGSIAFDIAITFSGKTR